MRFFRLLECTAQSIISLGLKTGQTGLRIERQKATDKTVSPDPVLPLCDLSAALALSHNSRVYRETLSLQDFGAQLLTVCREVLLDALSPLGKPGQGVVGGEGAIYLWAKLPEGERFHVVSVAAVITAPHALDFLQYSRLEHGTSSPKSLTLINSIALPR